ncbi:MAG: winged helix-turn-helix domain-containing protein [Nitrososphaerales archaeon]
MNRRVRQHRNRLEIINDILTVAIEGSKKTRIMYRANLSYDQLVEYLSFLLDEGLVMKVEDAESEGTFIFRVSDKGKIFLKTYSELAEILPNKGKLAQNAFL